MHVELWEQIDSAPPEMAAPSCRFCGAPLRHTFVDLGMSPLCESYVPAERLGAMEPFYPLHARICERCLLVQLDKFVAAEEIFAEYAYFSSYSASWVEHARGYVEMTRAFNEGRIQPRRTTENTTPTRFEDFAKELAVAYAAA